MGGYKSKELNALSLWLCQGPCTQECFDTGAQVIASIILRPVMYSILYLNCAN